MCYVDQAKLFFRANGINDTKRHRNIFLTLVGATVFDRLVDLLIPRLPAEAPIDENINALKAHYKPGCTGTTLTIAPKELRNRSVNI